DVINEGIPVVIWRRDNGDPAELERDIAKVPLLELPRHVYDWRRGTAWGSPAERGARGNVVLMWDDPYDPSPPPRRRQLAPPKPRSTYPHPGIAPWRRPDVITDTEAPGWWVYRGTGRRPGPAPRLPKPPPWRRFNGRPPRASTEDPITAAGEALDKASARHLGRHQDRLGQAYQ